jgi:hypothetical protein
LVLPPLPVLVLPVLPSPPAPPVLPVPPELPHPASGRAKRSENVIRARIDRRMM